MRSNVLPNVFTQVNIDLRFSRHNPVCVDAVWVTGFCKDKTFTTLDEFRALFTELPHDPRAVFLLARMRNSSTLLKQAIDMGYAPAM